MASVDIQDEFFVKAVSDYNAAAENELDLRHDHYYQVIDHNDAGWWYCLDEDGIDGWAPASYMEKCSPQLNAKLKKEYEEKMKEEEKRRMTQLTFNNYDDDQSTVIMMDDNNQAALKNELIAKANSFAKRMREKQRQSVAYNDDQKNNNPNNSASKTNNNNNNSAPQTQPTYNIVPKNKKIISPQQSAQQQPNANSFANKYQYTKNNDPTKSDMYVPQVNQNSNYMWDASNFNAQNFKMSDWQKKQAAEKQKKVHKRMFWQELTDDQKNIDDKYRPQLTTIVQNNSIQLINFINKQYNVWSIDEILYFLIQSAKTHQSTFQLTSVIGVLAQKCKNNLGITKYVLKSNGLNILLFILQQGGDKDVAISNCVCRAITTLCEHTNIIIKFPAEKHGVFYIATAVRNSLRNPIFCCHAMNCVVNFVKKNPTHKSYILNDQYNSKLVYLIIDGMESFRYSSAHTKNVHCSKVQIAGCLALQNLAAHPLGQKIIGPAGVEVVLDSFVAHIDDDAVVAASLGALLNICSSSTNAGAFLQCEGLTFLSTLLDNEDTPSKSRLLVCKMIHNMSCDPFLSRKLIDEYTEDCEQVIMKLIAFAEYGTELYLSILRFLSTLLQKINKKKLEFMKDLLEQQFVQMLIDALEYDYAISRNELLNNNNGKYKKMVINIYDHIIIILNQYYATNDDMCCAFVIDETENDTNTWIPAILISMARCYQYASHMIWEIFKLFDLLTINNISVQKKLIDGGIVDLLINTNWYNQQIIDPDAVRLGANILLKLLQSYPYHKKSWTNIKNDLINIQKFIQYIKIKHSNYNILIKNLERQLKYIG